jgi:hypothetical protein
MPIKLERRGKYPGVKVHLDKDQCLVVQRYMTAPRPDGAKAAFKALTAEIAETINALLTDDPSVLEERTEEQIIKELEIERQKSEAKLKKLAAGKDWKTIKETADGQVIDKDPMAADAPTPVVSAGPSPTRIVVRSKSV